MICDILIEDEFSHFNVTDQEIFTNCKNGDDF